MCFMAVATRDGSAVGPPPAPAPPGGAPWGLAGRRPGGLTPGEGEQRRGPAAGPTAGSPPGGLPPAGVERRRGTATVPTAGSPAGAVVEELAESLLEPLMLLLIGVGVLSLIFGELRDAIAIFVVIVIIGAVEATAEVRAKRALRALRDLSAR